MFPLYYFRSLNYAAYEYTERMRLCNLRVLDDFIRSH